METMIVGDSVDNNMSCGLGEQSWTAGMRARLCSQSFPRSARLLPFIPLNRGLLSSLWVLPSGIVKEVLRSLINETFRKHLLFFVIGI